MAKDFFFGFPDLSYKFFVRSLFDAGDLAYLKPDEWEAIPRWRPSGSITKNLTFDVKVEGDSVVVGFLGKNFYEHIYHFIGFTGPTDKNPKIYLRRTSTGLHIYYDTSVYLAALLTPTLEGEKYIEVKLVKNAGDNWTMSLRVDGITINSVSFTLIGSTLFEVDKVSIHDRGWYDFRFDSIYIAEDFEGSFGPVESYKPISDYAVQFVPSSIGSNADKVSDTDDIITESVTSQNVNDKDLYNFRQIQFGRTVHDVNLLCMVRRSSGGTAGNFQVVALIDNVEYVLGEYSPILAWYPSNAGEGVLVQLKQDPLGNTWTSVVFNKMKLGIKDLGTGLEVGYFIAHAIVTGEAYISGADAEYGQFSLAPVKQLTDDKKDDAHDPCGYWLKKPPPKVVPEIWYSCPQTVGVTSNGDPLFFATLDANPDFFLGFSYNIADKQLEKFYKVGIKLVTEPAILSDSRDGLTVIVARSVHFMHLNIKVFQDTEIIADTLIETAVHERMFQENTDAKASGHSGVIIRESQDIHFATWIPASSNVIKEYYSTDKGITFNTRELAPLGTGNLERAIYREDESGDLWLLVSTFKVNDVFSTWLLKLVGSTWTVMQSLIDQSYRIYNFYFFGGRVIYFRGADSSIYQGELGQAVVGDLPIAWVDLNINALTLVKTPRYLIGISYLLEYSIFRISVDDVETLANVEIFEHSLVGNIQWQVLAYSNNVLVRTNYYATQPIIQNGVYYGLSMQFWYSRDLGITWTAVPTFLMMLLDTTHEKLPDISYGKLNPLWPMTKN